MGLDVTAYSNLRYIGHHEIEDDSEHPYDPKTFERLHVEAYSYKEFERHALAGVPNHRDEQWGDQVGVKAGCFELTEKTQAHGAGRSYGGYNRWRKGLADQFNPYRDNGDSPPSPEGPFYELIWFADNEGTLCELAAINLLANFRHYETEYVAARASGSDADEFDIQFYRDFLRFCELAADGGLIDFH